MVSIIVPVYNAEKYLNGCIDSILCQSYDNFELILADDGSSDSSPAICDKYAAQNKRVTVIHKTNGGSSSARNAGIAAAKGEYIAFVDSDDTVSPDYLRLLVKNIEGHDISIGTNRMDIVRENKSVVLAVNDKSYTLDAFIADMRTTFKGQYVNSPVNKLFRADIIKNNSLSFDDTMNVGEDCVFCLSYLEKCSTIRCFSDVIYYYNVRGDYVRSESYVKNRFADRVKMCRTAEKFYRQDTPYYYKRILSEYMHTAHYEFIDNPDINDEKVFLQQFINEYQLDCFINKAKLNPIDKLHSFKALFMLLKTAEKA